MCVAQRERIGNAGKRKADLIVKIGPIVTVIESNCRAGAKMTKMRGPYGRRRCRPCAPRNSLAPGDSDEVAYAGGRSGVHRRIAERHGERSKQGDGTTTRANQSTSRGVRKCRRNRQASPKFAHRYDRYLLVPARPPRSLRRNDEAHTTFSEPGAPRPGRGNSPE